MAKFSGKLGIRVKSKNSKPGITTWVMEEYDIRGDILSDVSRRNNPDRVNDDLSVTNRLSILADKRTRENMQAITYVVLDGLPWKVSSIENARPKLILNLGVLWNGERPTSSN